MNNLRYICPESNLEAALTAGQRRQLVAELMLRDEMDFSAIRKNLGLIDSVRFNLERGERSRLKGHTTDFRVASPKVLGKAWHARSEREKDAIVRLLLDPNQTDHDTAKKLSGDFGLSDEAVEKLVSIDFGPGYARLSLKAIEKLLPHLERGMPYQAQSDADESALHAAGYLRRDELARHLFGQLPTLDQIRSGPLAELNNPVVRVALHELRRVVNSIVREYGKPDAIHVELARSLKMGAEKRARYNKRIRGIEEERSEIAALIRDSGFSVSREAIQRYQLWMQQGQRCVYTDRAIGIQQLFAGEVDIDHILPRSRTLDDSMMNKVVSFRSANFAKGQQTPYEWLANSNPVRYEELLARVKELPYAKRVKFIAKELKLDDFIARQLVDTGYITRMAIEYLKMRVGKDHDVLGGKGQLTAELRHQWGLNSVLQELPDSPAWGHGSKLRPGEKNRADHRHHAIDAIIIALINRSRLQNLARTRAEGGTGQTGEILPVPWPNFRQTIIESIRLVNVSHRVRRKVSGRLHDETFYGKTDKPGEFVVRKPVENLTPNEIKKIRDPGIRRIVERALSIAGVAFGRGAKPEAGAIKRAMTGVCLTAKDGRKIPIKRVRLIKPDLTIHAIRKGRPDEVYVRPGSTHHLCIFEWIERDSRGKPKNIRGATFVTMMEAARRIKERKPIVQRTHPERPDAKFIMSLSSGELVLAEVKGEQKLLSFKTAASTQGQIYFANAADARKSADYEKFVFKCSTLKARKVTVDPLGRVRWAND